VKKARFGIIGTVVVLAAMAAQATPYLLGVDYNNNNLVSIDPTTGVFSVLGTISGSDSPSNFLGIANGPGGNIYGIDTTNGNLYQLAQDGTILANININSGGVVSNFSEGDMTFNGSTGYVDNTAGGGSPGLFSFTTSAGSLTSGPIGGVTAPTFDGLAFVGSTLYGLLAGDGTSTGGGTQLYIIDTTTGVATALPNPTGISLGTGYNFGGLAYSGSTLYAEVSGDDPLHSVDAAWLYTIDPSTGLATLVSQIEDSGGNPFDGGLSGIAFEAGSTPEPGTLGLMFLGLSGLALGRRRLFKR
jgi:hypothetical protein